MQGGNSAPWHSALGRFSSKGFLVVYEMVQVTAKKSVKDLTIPALGLQTKIWQFVFGLSCYKLEDLSENNISFG